MGVEVGKSETGTEAETVNVSEDGLRMIGIAGRESADRNPE